MRDAFGGTFMIEIFLVFLLVFIGLTSVCVNYAKAFKVKDKIIDYLESNEITNVGNMTVKQEDNMQSFFDKEIIGNMNYVKQLGDYQCGNALYCNNGIKIELAGKSNNNNGVEGVYYRVTTYFGWDLPFMRVLLRLDGDNSNDENANLTGIWTISGETRLIVRE